MRNKGCQSGKCKCIDTIVTDSLVAKIIIQVYATKYLADDLDQPKYFEFISSDSLQNYLKIVVHQQLQVNVQTIQSVSQSELIEIWDKKINKSKVCPACLKYSGKCKLYGSEIIRDIQMSNTLNKPCYSWGCIVLFSSIEYEFKLTCHCLLSQLWFLNCALKHLDAFSSPAIQTDTITLDNPVNGSSPAIRTDFVGHKTKGKHSGEMTLI